MSTSTKPIICCGFTPCIQRILEYKKVAKGEVNRAVNVTLGIGGKGANTARMVTQLDSQAELIEFAGGANGKQLETLLENEGVGFRHIQVEGETRICQTLVETGDPETTELVEEMPPISSNDWNRMLDLFQTLDLTHSWTAISGKLPAGAPADGYAEICDLAHQAGGRVIIDAQGEPLLLALKFRPALVKINDVELEAATGCTDLQTGCRKLMELGAESVLITRGSRTAFFMDNSQTMEIFPPEIVAINPVGSGDAVTAGIAVALSVGLDMKSALIQGMACGAANALNLLSGYLKVNDVERLKSKVQLKPIGK